MKNRTVNLITLKTGYLFLCISGDLKLSGLEQSKIYLKKNGQNLLLKNLTLPEFLIKK